jgi:hypothetical protein
MESSSNTTALSDPKLPVKLKLSALWTSVMFCYIYADYFELFKPGRLEGIIAGNGPIGPTTQGGLVVASLVLAIPSVMIFLSIEGNGESARQHQLWFYLHDYHHLHRVA